MLLWEKDKQLYSRRNKFKIRYISKAQQFTFSFYVLSLDFSMHMYLFYFIVIIDIITDVPVFATFAHLHLGPPPSALAIPTLLSVLSIYTFALSLFQLRCSPLFTRYCSRDFRALHHYTSTQFWCSLLMSLTFHCREDATFQYLFSVFFLKQTFHSWALGIYINCLLLFLLISSQIAQTQHILEINYR